MIFSISAGQPARWTGIIALVCSVIAASIRSALREPVSGSTSTKTGRAWRFVIVLIVAMNV
jgi:hypothetical protein